MAVIELSSGKDQILANRKMLNAIAVVAFITSLFLWSVAPFVATSNGNRDKFVRYFSLICAILGGDILLACGRKLERNQPLYKALEKAQENVFIHQVATSQYTYEQEITKSAEPSSQVAVPRFPPPENFSGVENPENQRESDFSGSGNSEENFPDQLDLEKISAAVKAGEPDSFIITDLLGMRGRRYQEGKELLEEIKLTVGVRK